MSKKYFIANWKMNLSRSAQEKLSSELVEKKCFTHAGVTNIICPSYVHIPHVAEKLSKQSVHIGAQDVSWESAGAMTGEVSPEMLKDYGVEYVIIGHSERRHSMDENEQMVSAKVAAAIREGLIPIICVGETFEQRKNNQTDSVLVQQVTSALSEAKITHSNQFIIAYEPVWVIGTGQAVALADALHAIAVVRHTVRDVLHGKVGDLESGIAVLYGGSVTVVNIKEFIHEDINGVLVGGASLKAEECCGMVQALQTAI